MSDSTIINNDVITLGGSDGGGGGIFTHGGGAGFNDFTNLTIADNTVAARNEALGGGFGAGAAVDLSFVTLSGNTASATAASPDAIAAVGANFIRLRATAIDNAVAGEACGTGTDASIQGGTFADAGANAAVGNSCNVGFQDLAPGGLGLGALSDHTGGSSAYQAGATGFKAPITTREPTTLSVLLERAATCTDADGGTVATDARGTTRPQGDACDTGAHQLGRRRRTDGVPNNSDNCPVTANADQANLYGDGAGDACDNDTDGDGSPTARTTARAPPTPIRRTSTATEQATPATTTRTATGSPTGPTTARRPRTRIRPTSTPMGRATPATHLRPLPIRPRPARTRRRHRGHQEGGQDQRHRRQGHHLRRIRRRSGQGTGRRRRPLPWPRKRQGQCR